MEAYRELEEAFAQWLGVTSDRCVACSSGTAALHLALESLPLRRPSVVAVPDYTMVACARAVTLAGMTPTFVDCREDLLMDPVQIPIHPRPPNAVMAVHVYGRRCDMVGIHHWAQLNYGLVIEDMAEIHGTLPHPLTHAACWSFYRNKIVGGEEGGMVLFKYPRWAEKARQLRSLGQTARHDFLHVPRGHNYRLANCLAELVLESLGDFEENFFLRRQVEAYYDSLIPEEWKMPFRDAPWVYDLRILGMDERQQQHIVDRLIEHGHQARHGFKPMTAQEEYRFIANETMKHEMAKRLSTEIIYLPITPDLTDADCRVAVAGLLAAAKEVGIATPEWVDTPE